MNIARIASGGIGRTHRESHPGTVNSCPTCARDWAAVEEASGVRAPRY